MPTSPESITIWLRQTRFVAGLGGLILSALTYYLVSGDQYPMAPSMAAIVVLMAIWWIFEVIPIPVTSLLPVLLFPLFNIGSVMEAGVFYGRPIIFLFLGGFILALGLQVHLACGSRIPPV
jgi:sodium-dependent dicarboxylate transporter 2/3/5